MRSMQEPHMPLVGVIIRYRGLGLLPTVIWPHVGISKTTHFGKARVTATRQDRTM